MSTIVNQPINIDTLANDTDYDSDSLQITSYSTPSSGSLSIETSSNSFIYTPSYGSSGPVSFTYQISDGKGGNDQATVNIRVNNYAPAPSIEWSKSFGGSSTEHARAIRKTTDGGYIFAGATASSNGDITQNKGGLDVWIVKLDSQGNIDWQKTYGGSSTEYATAVKQTRDGGYIVTGYTMSNDGDVTNNNGNYDIWILRLTSEGNISWQKTLGGSSRDYGRDIIELPEGGFVVLADINSNDGDISGHKGSDDIWLVKLSNTGDIVWSKTLGGGNVDYGRSIALTNQGGFIVAGASLSLDGDVTGRHGSLDGWVVKLDANANIIWQKTLGGDGYDATHSVIATSNGNFVVAGYNSSNNHDVSGNHGGTDLWIIKLDTDGNLIWQNSLGGRGHDGIQGDSFTDLRQTIDRGYIIAGNTSSIDGDVFDNKGKRDIWIVKLDHQGQIVWQKTMGGSENEAAVAIVTTKNGGYTVLSETLSNNGDVSSNNGNQDMWVVKFAPDTRYIDPAYSIKSIRISSGTFSMGSSASETDRAENEGPQHQVTISHDFLLRPI